MTGIPIEIKPAIQEFIQKHKIEALKQNERPWGGYELAMSIEDPLKNRIGFFTTRPWGASIPISVAMQDILEYYGHELPNSGNFSKWLGDERLLELQKILHQLSADATSVTPTETAP